jgi:hypothetical protein
MLSENVSSADNQQERVPKNIEHLKWYLAGFADGEGCFSICISRSTNRFGWKIDPLFQVYQHMNNSKVLYIYRDVLNCGYISTKGGNPVCHIYCVDKITDLLDKVCPFFEQYPLIGEKHKNYQLFKRITEGLFRKEHQSQDGFVNLVNLTFQMNDKGKYRKNSYEVIIGSLEQSPETKRQTLYVKRQR